MKNDREYHLEFCNVCTKRFFSREKGIVCSLTNAYASFQNTCPEYEVDAEAKIVRDEKRRMNEQQEIESESLGLSAIGIKNGILAGTIAIIGAILWFILGIIYFDRIFFYPAFLLFIGIAAIYFGSKRKKKERLKVKKQ